MFIDAIYIVEAPFVVLKSFPNSFDLFYFTEYALSSLILSELYKKKDFDPTDYLVQPDDDDEGECSITADGVSLCELKAEVSLFSFEFNIILFLSCIIVFFFFIILSGMLINRINLFYILICLELLFLLVILSFIFSGLLFVSFSIGSSVFVLFILAIAACEAVLGLSIFILRTRIVTK